VAVTGCGEGVNMAEEENIIILLCVSALKSPPPVNFS
jgi:hypothetical protein